MKKLLACLLLTTTMVMSVGCGSNTNEATTAQNANEAGITGVNSPAIALQLQAIAPGEELAVIQTNKGDITVRLFPEEAPKAVENFKTLAKQSFYDDIIFHRVINDFMIQTGDPTGTGMGGESMWGEPFENEISYSLNHIRGALSMANAGPDTNGSQFFIVQNSQLDAITISQMEYIENNFDEPIENPFGEPFLIEEFISKEILQYYIANGGTPHLDGNHTVFGQVVYGMDVVDAIASVEVGQNDRPIEEVYIQGIEFIISQ
jgi:cyclophilin family peptidyl-prolyl cis-trans isomerase